jgi:tetratricopeptide (TPR) repeat protein
MGYGGRPPHPRRPRVWARRAVETLEHAAVQAPQMRGEALALWAWSEAVAGDVDAADELLRRAHGTAQSQQGDLFTHLIGHARAFSLVRRGRFEESYGPQIAAAAASQRAGRPDLSYGCWVNAACAAACAGEFERALEFIDRGLAGIADTGLATLEVHLLAARAHVLMRMGRLDEARTVSESERRLAERLQNPALQATGDHDRGLVALALGEYGHAARMLAAALAHDAPVSRPLARLAMAEALVRMGRCDEAEQQLTRAAASPNRSIANDLIGKRVCFTGELISTINGKPVTRALAHSLAERAGLAIASSVTKQLDVLVVADPCSQSGKAKKARQYGTRIIAEAVFWNMIGVAVD